MPPDTTNLNDPLIDLQKFKEPPLATIIGSKRRRGNHVATFLRILWKNLRTSSLKKNGIPIICPNVNCGYKGLSARKSRGSTGMMAVLLVIFFPIGIVYAVLASGYNHYCPNCGMKVLAERK